MAPGPGKPLILCVDDEPMVLDGLGLHLRRSFRMETAYSGAAGLAILEKGEPFAVVLSDMRMPGMDGAAFLTEVRKRAPETTRMLLTGHAELESAIAAVNGGQIFRFLTKPCPPAELMAAMEAAARQHHLVTSEKVLLEKTLHGSIKALTDVLALASPVAFGRANRIKQRVTALVERLGLEPRWQVEMAAMLSQLGCVTLPPETVEKAYYGAELTPAEKEMVARTGAVTAQLLEAIPRIEQVREILALAQRPPPAPGAPPPSKDEVVLRGAQVLLAAVDLDLLEAQGSSAARALDTMRGRAQRYAPDVLAALAGARDTAGPEETVRELPISAVRPGMVFAEDVKMTTGALLVARGYAVTPGLLERIRNFKPGSVREPVRIVLDSAAA